MKIIPEYILKHITELTIKNKELLAGDFLIGPVYDGQKIVGFDKSYPISMDKVYDFKWSTNDKKMIVLEIKEF